MQSIRTNARAFAKFALSTAIFGYFKFLKLLKPSRQTPRNSALILAFSAGGVGDAAMLESTLDAIRRRGISRIGLLLSYGGSPGEGLGKIDEVIDISALASSRPGQLWALAAIFSRYDSLFIFGADIMDGGYGTTWPLSNLELVTLASHRGLIATVLGFSFNSNPVPAIVHGFRKLPKDVRLCLRDPVSLERFRRFVGRECEPVADVAFLLRPDAAHASAREAIEWIHSQRAAGRTVVGLNINDMVLRHLWAGKQVSAEDVIQQKVVPALKRILATVKNCSFLLVPHDIRDSGVTISDFRLATTIMAALSEQERSVVSVVTFPVSPGAIKAIAAELDLVVTGRMHLAIETLGAGVPAAGIAYQGKFEGLYRHFELEGMTIEPQAAFEGANLAAFINALLPRLKELGDQVRAKIDAIKAQAERNFELLAPIPGNPDPRGDPASIRKVIAGSYCVGCGACAVATENRLHLACNEYGYFQVKTDNATDADWRKASAVCPFSEEAIDEDEIAKERPGPHLEHYDRHVGYYQSLYAGRVSNQSTLLNSSSGGLTSWVISELLRRGDVDGVVHVGPTQNDAGGRLFDFFISNSIEELNSRTKSRYYAVQFSTVLQQIRGDGRRYAFVGTPCFVKAVRLLCRQDPEYAQQIKYCIGLVCGHLKSSAFAELLAWQLGIGPSELRKFDFRIKDPSRSANQYSVAAWSTSDETPATCPSASLYGSNWGHALFQLKACDFCDDVMAETADVSFGDAWLPRFEELSYGTNIVICRNEVIRSILDHGASNKAIQLESLTVEDLIESQAGNYRHRWDGLSVRLADARSRLTWVPPKRVKPGSRRVPYSRKLLVRLRRMVAAKSHLVFREARQRDDLHYFMVKMSRLTSLIDAMHKYSRFFSSEFVFSKLLNPMFLGRKVASMLSLRR